MTARRLAIEVVAAETDAAFRFGRPAQRASHAPVLRGAFVMGEESVQPDFYALEQYGELWKALRGADELITWNGNHFTLLVLRRLFGAKYFPITRQHVGLAWGGHVDLCEVIECERRLTHRISLAKAIKLNFGDEVRPRGAVRQRGADERLRRGHDAVGQVMRLWKVYRHGEGLSLQGGPVLFHPENTQRF